MELLKKSIVTVVGKKKKKKKKTAGPSVYAGVKVHRTAGSSGQQSSLKRKERRKEIGSIP